MGFRYGAWMALAMLAALASGTAAQQAQPGWIADPKTGCKVWNFSPQPNETISWSGGCANGLAQGKGVLQWFESGRPTERYAGEYRDGRKHGRGVNTWVEGGHYDGEYRDNKPNGSGTFYDASSGETFTGFWTNGCFSQGTRRAWINATKEECGFR